MLRASRLLLVVTTPLLTVVSGCGAILGGEDLPGLEDGGAQDPAGDSATSETFVGIWNLSGTESFSNCTNGGDGAMPVSRVFTWTANGPGLSGQGSNCTFEETVSGETASLAPDPAPCTFSCIAPSCTGAAGIYQQDFASFTWILGADGTTANVTETGTQSVTPPEGSVVTCQFSRSETATKQ
jgi:hypothetical protein